MIRIKGNFRTFYDLEKKIEKKGYLTTYIAKDKQSGEKRTIQILDKNEIISKEPSSNEIIKYYIKILFKKISYMKIMEGENNENHNIIKYYEYFHTKDEFVIVSEFYDITLLDFFEKNKQKINEYDIYNIFSQLNNTFKIMEKYKIVYNSLKLENIFLVNGDKQIENNKFKLRITDDSCSLINISNNIKNEDIKIRILAPEILKGDKYNEKADLWSLGVLLYTLSYKKYPYDDNKKEEILNNINKIEYEKNSCSDLNDLIKKLLIQDPQKRYTWSDYFNHSFFKGDKNNEIQRKGYSGESRIIKPENYLNYHGSRPIIKQKLKIIPIIKSQKENILSIRNYKDYRNIYDIGNTIHEGYFCKVYEANLKGTNQKRAIKIIDKNVFRKKYINQYYKKPNEINIKPYIDCYYNEIKYMKIAEGVNKENKNILKVYEFFDTEEEFVIVMELCDDDLSNYLINKKESLSEREKNDIINQLNNTFYITCKNKIILEIIELDNILIKYTNKEKSKYIIKLKLINGAELKNKLKSISSEKIYNIKYNAPEVLFDRKYNEKSDLWNLGVIIYLLNFKEFPFTGDNENDILNQIYQEEINLKRTENQTLDNLIKELLNVDQLKRLNWDQYFNHPFFKTNKLYYDNTQIIEENNEIKEDYKKYYEIEKEIEDCSGFAVLYQAKEKKTKQLRCIKIYSKNKIIEYIKRKGLIDEDIKPYINEIHKEINYMKIVESKNNININIVKLYEYFDNNDEIAIVMELCDDNLLNILAKKKKPLTPEEIFEILNQLNNSFKIMIEKNIINESITLENIFIKYKNNQKQKYSVKLKVNNEKYLLNNLINKSYLSIINMYYIAPEILKGEKYNEKCLLWNLGIIIYILSFKEYPYTGGNKEDILNNINLFESQSIKETTNSNLNDLIMKLLKVDPKTRININDYLNHPFFKN